MSTIDPPDCFLFDNGSFRAASTLGLRRLATALWERLGVKVRAVSLLHSTRVDEAELDGRTAELLEPAVEAWAAAGGKAAVLLPLFFGPSGALVDYLPPRLARWRERYPATSIELARELVDVADESDRRIAGMLADAVRATIAAEGLRRPAVLLTDHGTPQATVAAVRDHLRRQMAGVLGQDAVRVVGAASMERRAEKEYAFNEPLLERALREAPFNEGDVVVALQFLQPGRHAGPGGDIATICLAAEAVHPGLRTYLTPTFGTPDIRLLALLAERYEAAARELGRRVIVTR